MAESLYESFSQYKEEPQVARTTTTSSGYKSYFPNVGNNLGRITPGTTSTSIRGGLPTTSTLTTSFVPSGEKPVYSAPKLNAPEYPNEREIAAETQRLQAPSIRKLRQALQQVQTQRFDNPNVRRMTVREALAGFGEGLGEVQTGARREARQALGEKFARQLDVAKTEYQGNLQAANIAYQRAWDLYLQSGTTTTTAGTETNVQTPNLSRINLFGSKKVNI